MERAWSVGADQPETVVVRSDLVHGTTIWRDGTIVVDDASWPVQRSYRIPSTRTPDVWLSIVRAWPFRTRVSLAVGGRAVAPVERTKGDRELRRPIPWWGRFASAVAISSMAVGLLNIPFAILFSFASLRAARGTGGSGRVAGVAAMALAPWVIGISWGIALGLPEGVRILREGGWTMLPLIAIGFTAIALAVAHAVQAHARSLIRVAVVAAAVAGGGAYLTHGARAQVDEVLAYANPADRETIRGLAYAESAHSQQLGLSLAITAVAIAAIGEVRRVRKRDG